MKKTLLSFFVAVLGLVVFSCGSKDNPKSTAEKIGKIWTATKVDQNSTTVYTKGGTTNVQPGYSNFRLDLSSPSVVKYTEFDGNTFSGTWTTTDQVLTLTGLTPQPTGTGGTIAFNISSLTDNSVVLTRTTTSQKTGGTTNTYSLSNP